MNIIRIYRYSTTTAEFSVIGTVTVVAEAFSACSRYVIA